MLPQTIKLSGIIDGYKVIKKGIPTRVKQGAFSKDENSSFLNAAIRPSRGIPGPGNYSQTLSWTTSNGNFGLGGKRNLFTDEAAKKSKLIPSAAEYDPVKKQRLILGHQSKTEGIDYMSDAQYVGSVSPGPCSYKADVSLVPV